MEQKTKTTNNHALQDIVASSIKEYLTPKYPIYKIQYTHIKKNNDGVLEILMRSKSMRGLYKI